MFVCMPASMFVVALNAQKGGVGKTTLTVTLAVLAERAGKSAAIIDADPQANAAGWSRARAARGVETPLLAKVSDPSRLKEAIADAREDKIDWLFLDTQAGVSELPVTAASLADLVLIPCGPASFEMDAMAPTVRLVEREGVRAFFVINRGRSSGINNECAVALTSAYGLPAASTHISHRLPIVDCSIEGRVLPEIEAKPGSSIDKGKLEYEALWSWLTAQRSRKHGKKK